MHTDAWLTGKKGNAMSWASIQCSPYAIITGVMAAPKFCEVDIKAHHVALQALAGSAVGPVPPAARTGHGWRGQTEWWGRETSD